MISTVLLTVVFIALAACLWCVYACSRHASDAYDAAHDLRTSRGRLIAAEAACENIAAQLRKLSGKFHAHLWHDHQRDAARNDDDSDDDDAHVYATQAYPAPRGPDGATYDICENWKLAQKEGPQSRAAGCECAYCTAARAQRRSVKAALVPKSQPERIESMRKGLAS